ncbi:MAG TPA: c-type cytochrome [Anaerolineae bacterium]|nr:c-type cytochrome [Anaerolineae bacterium]
MNRTCTWIALITIALVITVALTLAGTQITRASPPAQAADGKAIYTQRCEVCHGAEGNGNGPAATNLDPKPRDFRRGWYKIRTTASGQLPTDDDLVQVIANGMPGTTMPAWKGVLSDEEMRAVATYIKSFASRFERETPALIAFGSKVTSSSESIARGKEIFEGQAAECVKCHGDAGRGDGPSADELTDDFDNVIVPADLTMPWLFRGGATADDIYRRLKTGLTGSPMPSYADVLLDDQVWDVANYVDSLGPDAPPELQASITAARVQGAIPADANAAEWQSATEYYIPLVGQIMRELRNYTPSIKGVWARALYNESELALLLRWHDRFQDTGAPSPAGGGAGGGTADALAVQFPAQLPAGDERPYFVFGDSAHPVNLWTWSAAANPSTGSPLPSVGDFAGQAPERSRTVEERDGTGSDSVSAQVTQNAQGAASFADGEYTLIVQRALDTGDAQDIKFETGKFIPIAIAAWDGWRGEQDAAGAISSWYSIYLSEPVPITRYVWVPAAMIVTAVLEWLVVRAVRRGNVKRET